MVAHSARVGGRSRRTPGCARLGHTTERWPFGERCCMIVFMVFQAVVTLVPPLQVAPACLGLELEVRTRSTSGRITLPIAHPAIEHSFLPPATTSPLLRADNGINSDWAREQSMTHAEEILTVRVDKVLFDWEAIIGNPGAAPSSVVSFGMNFDDWYRAAHSWMDLWSDQGLSGLQWQSTGSHTIGSGVAPDGSSIGWGNWEEIPEGLFNQRPAATPEMWSSAVRLANEHRQPSLSWQLIRRARATREPRQRVIDAATAAEVAIERLLTTSLSHRQMDTDQVDAVMRPLTGIVEKLRVLEAFSPPPSSLINRVGHRIAGPRNRAAHAGQYPADDEIKECIETAVAVLEIYDPLPGYVAS